MKKGNPLKVVPGLRDWTVYCMWFAAELITDNFDDVAAKLGVGDYKNLVLLRCVSEMGGMLSQAELSQVLRVNANSMVQRADTLEKTGFLRRERSKDNRRKYRIKLTPKAEKILHEFLKSPEPKIDGITPEELAALQRLCCSFIEYSLKEKSQHAAG
jgi:DNA-binding MarR family transcriptional regulator